MVFRGDIRNLIQSSDLYYLNSGRRRKILSKTISFEIEDMNKQISHIFEGCDLKENGDHTLIGYENLIIISNLCSSYDELISLIFNNRVDVFLDVKSGILRRLIKISKSKEDFIEICSHEVIFETLFQKKEGNLFYIFRILNTKEELFELLKNPNFIYFITKGKENNIEFILDYLSINSKIQLLELFNDGRWEHIKKLLKNGNIEDIKHILKSQQQNSLEIDTGIISFNTIWVIGTCTDAEIFNQKLLQEANYGDKSFVPIIWKGQIIAYLKMEEYGQESITGIRDVYDQNGTMLLTKGMIYAPAAEHEEYLGSFHIGSNDYFDLDKVGSYLSINPMRMLQFGKREMLDKLISNFITRNGFI